MLALTPNDIDLKKGKIHVKKIRISGDNIQNHTKTRVSRKVHINDIAMEAIKMLLETSKQYGGEWLFYNTVSPFEGEPIKSPRGLKKVFETACKELEIRQRPMYNMRHHYATFALMNGLNPAWMAKQLGHSVEEFFRTYATWINEQLDDIQTSNLDIAISKVCQKCVREES